MQECLVFKQGSDWDGLGKVRVRHASHKQPPCSCCTPGKDWQCQVSQLGLVAITCNFTIS